MDEDKKKKFEVRIDPTPDGMFEKNIYIGGERFEWEIDEASFNWAKSQGTAFFEAVKKDIANHFLASLSEVCEKRITLQDFQTALKTGRI